MLQTLASSKYKKIHNTWVRSVRVKSVLEGGGMQSLLFETHHGDSNK